MPIGSPSIILNSAMKGVTKSPQFSQLSPASQAALAKLANLPPGDTLKEFQTNNAAYQAAFAEAKQKGLISNTPLWQEILKGVAITGGAALAGPAMGALTGGGAAAGGSAAAAGAGDTGATLASMAPGMEGGLGTVGASVGADNLAAIGGGAAGTIAPSVAKGSSLLHDLLPSIIGAGAGVGGAAISAHANTEAAKIAAAQADKALAIQQQQYALQRQDTAPYRALGQGAVNNLGYGMGIDTTSNLAALSSTTSAIPSGANPSENLAPVVALGAKDASGQSMPGAGLNQTIPRPPTPAQQGLGALSQPNSGGTVRVQNPATGLVHLMSPADAAAAQQAGGVIV